jgi:large subunit ribosomal protein L24
MMIRKDDTVMVMTGDDKGSTGRVLRILTEKNKVVVEGVNRVYRHVKPNRRNQQGGRLSKEMPVDASNVQIFCPACRTGVRVGKRIEAGKKERVCKKCGGSLGLIADSNKTKKK